MFSQLSVMFPFKEHLSRVTFYERRLKKLCGACEMDAFCWLFPSLPGAQVESIWDAVILAGRGMVKSLLNSHTASWGQARWRCGRRTHYCLRQVWIRQVCCHCRYKNITGMKSSVGEYVNALAEYGLLITKALFQTSFTIITSKTTNLFHFTCSTAWVSDSL